METYTEIFIRKKNDTLSWIGFQISGKNNNTYKRHTGKEGTNGDY